MTVVGRLGYFEFYFCLSPNFEGVFISIFVDFKIQPVTVAARPTLPVAVTYASSRRSSFESTNLRIKRYSPTDTIFFNPSSCSYIVLALVKSLRFF